MGIAAAIAELRIARSSLFVASQQRAKLVQHGNAGVPILTAQFDLANENIAIARGDVMLKRDGLRLAIISGVP